MEETIVESMSTSLTFTMTEELYGRLTDRLRHVIQFSDASRRAAEEALALLEAARDAPDEQLDEGTAEHEAVRDVDVVIYLLAVHELLANEAGGKARYLAQAEAMAIIAALNRLAPAVLDNALALYEERSEPIGVILEAIATSEGAEKASQLGACDSSSSAGLRP
jgi:hypothetical protein